MCWQLDKLFLFLPYPFLSLKLLRSSRSKPASFHYFHYSRKEFMTHTISYRKKLTHEGGDLKVVVTAKYRPAKLEISSDPAASERDARAQVDAALARELESL